MDENINNNPEHNQQEMSDVAPVNKTDTNGENADINNFTMTEKGDLRSQNAAAAIPVSSRTFIVLGWISAALTAFINPYFAIAGISFGLLANRQQRGRGNVVIVVNVVLAAINFLFGLFLISVWRRGLFGF